MADFSIKTNAERAQDLALNLTGTLSHDKVVELAGAWIPEIRFHELERFHPIDVTAMFALPPAIFATMTDPARDAFRVPVGSQRFTPPVVRKDSNVIIHGGDLDFEKLAEDDGAPDSLFTIGDSLERSSQFFGSNQNLDPNLPQPAVGNPRVPRHPIQVRAEMRFLLETLHHELQADIPKDALWGRFNVVRLFFLPQSNQNFPVSDEVWRTILRAMVEAQLEVEAGTIANDDAVNAAIAQIPFGWSLNRRAWSAVKHFAFLEYYFNYAYNDFDQYESPFANRHEGDVEGCCIVFERRFLKEFATGARTLAQFVPHTVITSVHEERNDNDELKRLPVDEPNLSFEEKRARRELVVFVAVGSHATYLTAGSHGVLDWEDILTDFVPWYAWLPALPFLLLWGIAEHFMDSEDQTSDSGIVTGPNPQPGSTVFPNEIVVTPLSTFETGLNLYQAGLEQPPPGLPFDKAELARRAYPGLWGGTSGIVDHSSAWENKTARYFKKFLANGEIEGDIIL
jgi:hypothetical protein